MRFRFLVAMLLVLLLSLASSALAQTATTGTIVGTVTDKAGEVLSGAEIELVNTATGQNLKHITSEDGKFVFPSVLPGNYTLTVMKQGFRKAVVTDFTVEVAKSYTVNVSLEAGEMQQTVEVTASAGVELQTTDSTVGNVIQGKLMPLMPALTRTANELIRNQPLTTPDGAVAGSRQDQSTFLLDGIDVTNNSVGGLGTYMVLPIDGIEEFRVGVVESERFIRTRGRRTGLHHQPAGQHPVPRRDLLVSSERQSQRRQLGLISERSARPRLIPRNEPNFRSPN